MGPNPSPPQGDVYKGGKGLAEVSPFALVMRLTSIMGA